MKRKILLLVLMFGIMPIVYADTGAVYTTTNNPAGNNIIRYDRGTDGILTFSGTFPTNGLGSGVSLGNQGGLVLSDDDRTLLSVNAGSNEISVFDVRSDGLILTDKVSSGGIRPISITIHKNLVYVLNAGGIGNITGFHLSNDGKLSAISGSTRLLSNPSPAPAEIAFNPNGDMLVVTEKATNMIDTYAVDDSGLVNGPSIHPSNGPTPFGFAFDKRGILIVSEAPISSLSSYSVDDIGFLTTISKSIPDFEGAACWVAITKNGKFVYTANAGTNSISSYGISTEGVLTLLGQKAGITSAGPFDLAITKNSKFLYDLHSGGITGFQIGADGRLSKVTEITGLTGAINGLAAS